MVFYSHTVQQWLHQHILYIRETIVTSKLYRYFIIPTGKFGLCASTDMPTHQQIEDTTEYMEDFCFILVFL